MSEIAHLSLNSSSLYNSSIAGNSADLDEYIYSMPKSKCNSFLDRFHETKINNCDWDSTCSVEIPAYGILRRAMLKFEISWTQNSGDDAQAKYTNALIARGLFARLVKRADLMNSSRVILSLHDDIIQNLIYQMPQEESAKYRLAGLDNCLAGGINKVVERIGTYQNIACATPTNGTTFSTQKTITVYCPLPFSCFEYGGAGHPTKSNLDTRFLERLSVSLTMGKQLECVYIKAPTGGAVTQLPIIKSASLLTDFDIIASKTLDSIEKANFSTSSPLAQVFSNYVKVDHPFTSAAATTLNTPNFIETTMQLYNTQLAHSIIVVCRKIPTEGDQSTLHALACAANAEPKTLIQSNAAGSEISRVGSDFKTLDEIELTSSGRTLYKSKTHAEGLFLSNDGGHGANWFGQQEAYVGGAMTALSTGAPATSATTASAVRSIATEEGALRDINGCSATNFYVIPFANDAYKSNGIQGALALKNLNSLSLRVKLKHKAGVNYVLTAYVRYYQAIATESNSGRIQVSISN